MSVGNLLFGGLKNRGFFFFFSKLDAILNEPADVLNSVSIVNEAIDIYTSTGPGDIPENAVRAGISPSGEIFVGVVKHEQMTLPCKIVPKYNCCCFTYGGQELLWPVCNVS